MNSAFIAGYAIKLGGVGAAIGLVTFALSHYLWDSLNGPLPGYHTMLYPGNMTLVYFWHPIFTEEVNFWPKLLMLITGQFTVITGFSYGVLRGIRWVRSIITRYILR